MSKEQKKDKQGLEKSSITKVHVKKFVTVDPITGLIPAQLGKYLKEADTGKMYKYLEIAEMIEERDAHFLAVMGTRKRAVSQLELKVDPSGDDKETQKYAEFIQDWVDRDELESETFHILDAIGKGYSVTEIIWDTSGELWTPKELKHRDPRLFIFDDDMQTLYQRGENDEKIPLDPYKWIVHIHQAKSGLPIKSGLTRSCVWMWMFKSFSIKDWTIFAERYGQPIRIGKYGSGTNEEDQDILMQAVEMLGSDAAAIIPESMNIEFIEAADKKSNAEVYEKMARFMDEQMSKAVLGQTTTTDAISGGHAVSKEHNEVREDIERADAKLLASTLNQTLVKYMIDLNFGAQKKYPRIRIGREEHEDPVTLSQVAETAVKMGVKVSERGMRARLNLPEPEDDDDVLKLSNTQNVTSESPGETVQDTASKKQTKHRDPIDDYADDVAEDYQEIMQPILKLINDAKNNSSSYEEFETELAEITEGINEEQIAQSTFMANIAGQVEGD